MDDTDDKFMTLLFFFILAFLVLSIEACNDVANRKARVEQQLKIK
jgi:hypothetical protein